MNVLCILLVWSAMGLNLMVQGSNNVLGQLADCFLPAVRSAMIKTAGDSCPLPDDQDQIVIRDDWIWAAPASQKMTAAYGYRKSRLNRDLLTQQGILISMAGAAILMTTPRLSHS